MPMCKVLGREEHGGLGIPVDRDAYLEAVRYRKDHAVT